MNSELFSWGMRVPVSTALRGKSDLELSKEIQDSLSEVKWNMFGLEFFLVLKALLFLFSLLLSGSLAPENVSNKALPQKIPVCCVLPGRSRERV